jgi:cobalt-zinc-cadmium efflux system membrane fusion protein
MATRSLVHSPHALVRGLTTMGPVLALCLAGQGCKKAQAQGAGPEARPPADEVWLTGAEVEEGKIELSTLAEEKVEDAIVMSGRVTFDDLLVAHVFSPVTGRVVKIAGTPGERVKKGDPLAVLDSPDVGIASSDVSKAQADLVAADHDDKRVRSLLESRAASQHELEQAEDAYRKAQAEVERARQKSHLLKAGGVDAVSQTFTLQAGIDGEVISRFVSPGMEVQGQYGGGSAIELFTIGELDRVWVMADVHESDVARVKVGTPVTVKAIAYPDRPFSGTIDWTSSVFDKDTRTAKVRCSFANPDHLLRPEMFVSVSVSVERPRALALPRSAMRVLGEVTVVFVEAGPSPDGRTRFLRVPLSVDAGESGPWIQLVGPNVPKALAKGARVVTGGGAKLSTSG